MNRACTIVIPLLAFMAVLLFSAGGEGKTGIMNTKHNLSASGPGEIRALTETRVCVFCHTPHNAAPSTPLWNRALDPVNYTLYSSTSLGARPAQPAGPSRLCLSCHDGLVALGKVLRPAEGIAVTGEITPSRRSYLGTNLSDDHPVSFSYYDALPSTELAPVPPSDLVLYGNAHMHCSTCHDPHDDTYGSFLAVNNRYSALCTKCHSKDGWLLTGHRSSPSPWNGLPPNPWPRTSWPTVAENACENCHTPHSAGGPQRLLYYLEEEKNCYSCHNGHVALKNVEAQFQKVSRHPVEQSTIGVTPRYHDPRETSALMSGHVECVDCHNPHASNTRPAAAPSVSGRMEKVSGIDIAGSAVKPAAYEYEVCFKCHADTSNPFAFIPRVVDTTNLRVKFSTTNASYHPVAGIGANPDVPSIPSAFMPALTASSIIYCTDCHDSNESPAVGGTGPRGAHGSIYRPILRERYETIDNTIEGPSAYALCYRCHNRETILSDVSFTQHRKHVVEKQTPCSACHDAHGVKQDPATGDHTHLINFDTRIATPKPGTLAPTFRDLGSRRGSCTLVCHGKLHDNLGY